MSSEADLIKARRAAAKLEEGGDRWGLALSGGGIRSATFCFGLLRALASQKLLSRFDYLSTVSGGGYIGAALGRLYQSDCAAPEVQERLGREDTLLLWWLRSNGRYLTPAGARDLGQALASILRNILFSQFEVAVLMLLGAGVLLLPYFVLPVAPGASIGSVWWALMVVPLYLGLHFIFRYWFSRQWPGLAARLGNMGGALASGGAGALLLCSALTAWDVSRTATVMLVCQGIAGLLMLAPLTAALFSVPQPRPERMAALRLRYTKWLGVMLWVLLGLALAGALDLAGWWLADQLTGMKGAAAGAGLWALIVAAVRAGLPTVKRWIESAKVKAVKTGVLLNVGGLLLVLLMAVWWMTVAHLLVRLQSPWTCGLAIALLLGYVVLTAADWEVLNLSSLHNFYRARIERAYVSVGNYDKAGVLLPAGRFPGGSPLGAVTRDRTQKIAKLVEAVEGDDVDLGSYSPHQWGGPIHLVTCCINQSVDDRTGNYNADRLGIALTVSSMGVETGTAVTPTPLDKLPPMGKLSRWVAISGAAAGSGMGSQTTPGLAALLFLSGLRLGYWTPKLLPPPPSTQATSQNPPARAVDRSRRWFAALMTKPSLLLAEFVARFPGLRSTAWYVSDGGHFENTGVYCLLKRKLDVIVMADCGADPQYAFDDFENLVRKARIDYGAAIELLDPESLKGEAVILARIRYFGVEKPGLLVVVKPRMVPRLSLEIAGYAARNPTFPQQATADQFFDEPQWEAYHQLGVALGSKLTPAAVQGWQDAIGISGSTTAPAPAA
ncbi:MAG: patatin-like phospholipase family protein [Burkholderiales bacterium]|nr:patatin-like phospholipase family protein [Burkholderiales bacterium]